MVNVRMVPSHLSCKREADEPPDYVGWHYWASKKAETHEQKRCPECLLWHIWQKKTKTRRRKSG